MDKIRKVGGIEYKILKMRRLSLKTNCKIADVRRLRSTNILKIAKHRIPYWHIG